MGGKSCSRTTSEVVRFEGGIGHHDGFNRALAFDPEKRVAPQLAAKAADHWSHVARYREYQEFINRPWTWKNRAAWLINKLMGE